MRTRILTALSVAILLVGPQARGADHEHEHDPGEDFGRWVNCEDNEDPRRHCEERDAEWRASSATIRVDGGRNGGGLVVGWDKDIVRVKAVINARGKSRQHAEEIAQQIRIQMNDDLITATGPETRGDESWSVVFRIWAPRKSNLDLRAENGPVGALGITGKLRLVTHNGPVSLIGVGGNVVAKTHNGPLSVRLRGARWDGAGLDAETINGPVSLDIPRGYSANLESGTQNGPSDVDLPVRMRRGRWFAAALGDGGKPVRVVTHNGPVKIDSQ